MIKIVLDSKKVPRTPKPPVRFYFRSQKINLDPILDSKTFKILFWILKFCEILMNSNPDSTLFYGNVIGVFVGFYAVYMQLYMNCM